MAFWRYGNQYPDQPDADTGNEIWNVTYTMPGVYTVTLTLSGPGGSHTVVKPEYIAVREERIYLPLVIRSTSALYEAVAWGN